MAFQRAPLARTIVRVPGRRGPVGDVTPAAQAAALAAQSAAVLAQQLVAGALAGIDAKADNIQNPWYQGPEARTVSQLFEMTGEVPLDAYDKTGSRVAPGVDSTDGIQRAFDSGYAIVPPLRGGDYPVAGTVYWEKNGSSFAAWRRRFSFGSDLEEIARRAWSIHLTTPGAEGAERPLFHIKAERCVLANTFLRGLGSAQNQVAVRVEKNYGPLYTGGAGLDVAFDDNRFLGFTTCGETVGWGVRGRGNRAGRSRRFWRLLFPADGTYQDPEAGGRSRDLAFRQIYFEDTQLHGTTYGWDNNGPHAKFLNWLQIRGVTADTGAQVFNGTLIGTLEGVNSINGSNVTDVEKHSMLFLKDGSNCMLSMIVLAGLNNDGFDRLPYYLMQLAGEVSVRGNNVTLMNCQRGAITMSSGGRKQVYIDGLKIVDAHQANDLPLAERQNRTYGPIDILGGSADLRFGSPIFETATRNAYGPLVSIAPDVSAAGCRIEFDPPPTFPPTRFSGFADAGARLNTRGSMHPSAEGPTDAVVNKGLLPGQFYWNTTAGAYMPVPA